MLKLDLQFFGGRGASYQPGSSTGSGGGGSIDEKWTQDTWSFRHEKANEKIVDQIHQTTKEMNEQYEAMDTVMDLYIADIGKSKAIAYYAPDKRGLGVNVSYADAQKMDAAYDASVKSGFHPPRSKKTGMQAVISHELGHALTQKLADKTGHYNLDKAASQIMAQARKDLKVKSNYAISSKISGYAQTNNAETIAEATADVYCNGNKARKESIAVVNAMKLEKMTPVWQHRFLTWGIIVAVFGMRFLFPILVVSVFTHLNMVDVTKIALFDSMQYSHYLELTHAPIVTFGGMFLMMLFFDYFFNI